MNTHNVNTATPESPKTWVNGPSDQWFVRKNCLLNALARIEGDLLMYLAFERMDVWTEAEYRQYLCPLEAAEIVCELAEIGGITSPAVYEMVCSVEALSLALRPACWQELCPEKLPELPILLSQSEACRNAFITSMDEALPA